MNSQNQENVTDLTARAAGLAAYRKELIGHIERFVPEDGAVESPEGLRLFRSSTITELEHGISTPALCLVVQGGKEVLLGQDLYPYDANHYLIMAAALPIESRITEASDERPCLGVLLQLDPVVIGSVIVETTRPGQRGRTAQRAFSVSSLDAELLDAVIRLVKLQDASAETARFLRPLITREIVFRLLDGEQGSWLRHVAIVGGHSHRIAEALERLRQEFNRPLRIEDFAREVGMSVSGFHHHFKAVTAMSPVQFQKRMRLQEARRLMLYENLDAARAGFEVGYEDSAHFNREYKRHFGHPPRRDVQRMKEAKEDIGLGA